MRRGPGHQPRPSSLSSKLPSVYEKWILSLLPAVFLYLLEESGENLVTVDLLYRASLGEDDAVVLAASHAVVGVAGLAGAVDDTAHDRDREVVLVVLELVFDLSGHPDHVKAQRAGTARTGDDVRTAVPQVQSRKYLVRHRYLLDRVFGERDADGIPDAKGEKLTQSGRALYSTGEFGPGLGDA